MWVANIKLNGEREIFGKRTKKFNVSLSGYPISNSIKGKFIYIYIVGNVFGEDKNKKDFLNSLKEEKNILKIESVNDFCVILLKRKLDYRVFYNPNLVYLKPVLILNNGDNLFELGSFDKKELIKFLSYIRKHYSTELSSIKNKEVSNISIISLYPKITNKQKRAFELALLNGYYEFPKKIDIHKLARLMDVSFSTYRTHLRKAESKLMPFVFNSI